MVAAAIVGSAVVGAVAGSRASSRAADAQNRATDAASTAANETNQLSREQWDWNVNNYNTNVLPSQQRAEAMNTRVSEEALTASQQQRSFSKENQDFWRDNYKPVEEQAIRDATNYDSGENIARRSGIAAANVNQQFSNARNQSARLAGRYGLSSTAFSGPAGASERAEALGSAGAQTGAAFDTMDKAIALRTGVTNLGRGIGNTAVNFGQLGNQSAGVASGAANSALNNSATGSNVMNNSYGARINGIGTSNGILTSALNNSSNYWGNQANGWGNFTGGMIYQGMKSGVFNNSSPAASADSGGTWI